MLRVEGTWGVYWGCRTTSRVAGQDGMVLGRWVQDNDRGGMQTSEGHICGPAEVPQMRVSLCAACHPWTRGRLLVTVKCPKGVVPPGPLPWTRGAHARPKNIRIDSKTSGDSDLRPNPDGTGELDRVVCGHWAPRCVPKQPHLVLVRQPRTTPDQWLRIDMTPKGP